MLRSRNTSSRRAIISNKTTSLTEPSKTLESVGFQSDSSENHKLFPPTEPQRPNYLNNQRTRGVERGQVKMATNAIARVNAVFLHFCRRSTIHGLNHMAQARSAKRRIFWFTISLFASFGFFVNLYYLIEKYVQRQVLTNVFHDYDSFVYPDISFCNVNPIHFPPHNTTQYNDLVNMIDSYQSLRKHKRNFKLQLADYLFMQGKDVYSHPAWSAIISCHYMQKRCNWRHFNVRRLWPYGSCFTFDATKMNLSRRIVNNMRYNGFRPDFRIVVYKALDYPKNHRLDPHRSLNVPSGILVMLHEAHSYPHIGESFIVDDCTQIDLKIVLKSHLKKLNNCQSHRQRYTYADKITKENTTYLGRQSDCVYDIIQRTLHTHCNCSWQTMPVSAENINSDFCLSEKRNYNLLKTCFPHFKTAIDGKNLRSCYRDLCTHTSYTTVISHSNYPAVRERNTHKQWLEKLAEMERHDMKLYGKSDLAGIALLPESNVTTVAQAYFENRFDLLDISFVERNFMMLRIVPASLFMDKVEETEEYPLSRLMSDIGGCVGLWVGASLITVFEFVDLLLDCTEVTSYRRPRKKNCNGSTGGGAGTQSSGGASHSINNNPASYIMYSNMYGNLGNNSIGLGSDLLREAEEEDRDNEGSVDDDDDRDSLVIERIDHQEDKFCDDGAQVGLLKLSPLQSATCSRTTSTVTANSFVFNTMTGRMSMGENTSSEPLVPTNWDYGTTTDIVTSV